MFSDGVIDQPNTERSRFGSNRLVNAIKEKLSEPMENIKVNIEKKFDIFRGDEELRDDITVLGLRLKNKLP